MQLFLSCIIPKYVSECLTCTSAVSVSYSYTHSRLSQHIPPVCLLILVNVVEQAFLWLFDFVLQLYAASSLSWIYMLKSLSLWFDFVFLNIRRSNVMDANDCVNKSGIFLLFCRCRKSSRARKRPWPTTEPLQSRTSSCSPTWSIKKSSSPRSTGVCRITLSPISSANPP